MKSQLFLEKILQIMPIPLTQLILIILRLEQSTFDKKSIWLLIYAWSFLLLAYNGAVVIISKCYLAQPSGQWSRCFSRKAIPVARQVWRAFCNPGTGFITFWRGRGTIFINGRDFILVDNAKKRHWRSVAMQVISEAGIYHGAECILRAAVRVRVPRWPLVPISGTKSTKSMTNLLIIPSVLTIVRIFKSW